MLSPRYLLHIATFVLVSMVILTGVPAVLAQSSSNFGLNDTADKLTDAEAAEIEAQIQDVEAAGAPTVVYLRVNDSSQDATIDDGRQLMEDRNVQSSEGARDGVVIYLNLDTDDTDRGYLALVAGEAHFDGGALPQSELDRISDRMLDRLADDEMADGILLGLELIEDALYRGPPEPTWLQQTMDRFAGGPISLWNAIALVAGSGFAVLAFRFWSTRPRVTNAWESRSIYRPGDLHPAYAGALVQGSVGPSQIEATILTLAQKGALAFEPMPDDPKKGRIVLIDRAPANNEIERTVMQILEDNADENWIIEHKHLKKLQSKLHPVQEQIRADLVEMGLFAETDQLADRKKLLATGLAAGLLSAVLFVLSAAGAAQWGFIGAALMAGAGLLSFILFSMYPVTTEEGERQAIEWRGYKRGVDDARKERYGVIDLDEEFPYIVSMGLTHRYKNHMEEASDQGYVPNWIGIRDTAESAYANYNHSWFIYWYAMHSAIQPSTGSAGSHGGAAGGSGASGGGF